MSSFEEFEIDSRLMEPQETEEDGETELSLRPQVLSEYIGQARAKDNLSVYIEAAKQRKDVLDHVLLYGPPGLGKTTLSNIIANEMNVNIRVTSGPALERQGDLLALLHSLENLGGGANVTVLANGVVTAGEGLVGNNA